MVPSLPTGAAVPSALVNVVVSETVCLPAETLPEGVAWVCGVTLLSGLFLLSTTHTREILPSLADADRSASALT